MRQRWFDFAKAAAALGTVMLLIVGEIRWPLAIVLLLLSCSIVKYWER